MNEKQCGSGRCSDAGCWVVLKACSVQREGEIHDTNQITFVENKCTNGTINDSRVRGEIN